MKHDSYLDLIEKGENWVRSGESQKLQASFKRLAWKNIPRRHRLPLANLARRGGLFSAALKVLAPVMKDLDAFEASPKEIAEYCVSLQKIGSVREALKRLEPLSPSEAPQSLLYRAFCLFTQWNYLEAYPILLDYVALDHLSNYEITLGRLNLAATQVHLSDFELALENIYIVREYAETQNVKRLIANTLELEAQILIQREQFEQAEINLVKAKELIGKDSSFDLLFIDKWLYIIRAIRSRSITPIADYRKLAHQFSHWESLRDADFQQLKIDFTDEMATKLFLGTPYTSYRERMIREFRNYSFSSTSHIYGSTKSVLDIEAGTFCGKPISRPGKLIHKTIHALNADYYRPISIGSLHAQLFEGEFYDPFSSPNRVHQAIQRTKKLLEDKSIAARILHDSHGYHFQYHHDDLGLMRTRSSRFGKRVEFDLLDLKNHFAFNEFRTQEALNVVSIPQTTLTRYLKQGIEEGVLEKVGAGPKTRYRFLDKSLSKSA